MKFEAVVIAVALFDGFCSSIKAISKREQASLNFTHVKVEFYLKLPNVLKIRRFSLNQTAI
jgi:hypothetical protein